MPEFMLRGASIGKISGILLDKDGTISNSERYLLKLSLLRIQEISNLLISKGFSSKEINQCKTYLSKAYGLTNNEINPDGITAIASRENNLISTATVLSIIGIDWPNSLEMGKEVFDKVDSLYGGLTSSIKQRSLLPGVSKTLKAFNSSALICAIISNDSKIGIETFIKMNNLKETISAFWSADDIPSKPNPLAVNHLCEKIHLSPQQCALIGDADSDLKMARQAGVGITIGYTAGWSQPINLSEHEHLINSWDEVAIQ